MNSRTTLILFVLALVVTGLFQFVESGRTFFYEPDPDQVFGRFAARSFDRIEITRVRNRLEIVRRDANWTLTSHQDFPAAPDVVDEMIEVLRSIRVRSALASVADDDRFEGTHPTVEFEVRGSVETLRFGQDFQGLTPPACYLESNGSTYLVDRRVREAFARVTAFELQETRVFPAEPNEVISIRAETDSGSLALQRVGDDLWRVVAPFSAPASKKEVDMLLNEVTAARANSFESGIKIDHPEWELLDSTATIELTTADQSYRARIGRRISEANRGEEVFLEQSPTDWVGRVPARLIDLMSNDRDRFVADRTPGIPMDQLKVITIVTGNGEAARRSEVEWDASDFAKLRIEDSRVRVPVSRSSFMKELETIASLEFAEVVPLATSRERSLEQKLAAYGLSQPVLRLGWEEDSQEIELRIGARQDSASGDLPRTRYLWRSDWADRVARIDPLELDYWLGQPWSLRSAGVFTAFSPLRVIEIWNRVHGGRRFQRLQRSWSEVTDSDRPIPVAEPWGELLTQLESSTLESGWEDPSSFAAAQREVFMTVTIPALPPRIPELVVLVIGDPDAPGGGRAWFVGKPWGFRLSAADVDFWKQLGRALGR